MSFIDHKGINLATVCWAALVIADGVGSQTLPCPPVQMQRLMPVCQDRGTFGESVSVLNDRIAVGRFDLRGGRVTTHVLSQLSGLWEFESDIVPPGLQSPDTFGHSVELHFEPTAGQWLLAAGSPERSTSERNSGTGYVFALDGVGSWVLQDEVLPDVVIAHEWFGTDVTWATAGERTFLIVGAQGTDGFGLLGSAYVFERDGKGIWRQQARLQAPDGTPEDAFGIALDSAESQDMTILVIGASGHINMPFRQPGAAYFYRFDESNNEFTLEAQFEAPDPYEQDQYGKGVSVSPVTNLPGFTHRAAVGRRNEGGFGSTSGPGAVYLYLRANDGTWQQEAHLLPPIQNPPNMSFGQSVNLAQDGSTRLLVGATNDPRFGQESGGVFVFDQDKISGNWIGTQALYGREQDQYDGFAVDLALGSGASAEMAVVGALATQCPGGTQFDAVGAVYSFDLDPGEPGNCPPPVLTLQKVPDCAGGQGGEIEVRWFQATPDRRARIAILFGRRTGNFVIPNGNPCAGTPLGLGSLDLQVAFIGSAGDFGAGRLVTTIPRSACGAYLQLVDVSRCKTSNVVRIE